MELYECVSSHLKPLNCVKDWILIAGLAKRMHFSIQPRYCVVVAGLLEANVLLSCSHLCYGPRNSLVYHESAQLSLIIYNIMKDI
jgi:hypothetical protein